jgi:hypothetical protein
MAQAAGQIMDIVRDQTAKANEAARTAGQRVQHPQELSQ